MYFSQATLKNALESVGALLVLNVIILEPVFDKLWNLRGQMPAYSDAGILSEFPAPTA